MTQQIVQKFRGLDPNVRAALPDAAEIVEFCEDGGIICREPLPDTDPSVKEPRLDPETGEQVYREYETNVGAFKTPVYEWPERTTRLVKYEPRKTGRVVRNTDFQESEAEKRARERAKKVEQFQEDLAEEFVDAGLDVGQLLEMLKGERAGEAQESGDQPEPEGEPAPADVGGHGPVQTAEEATKEVDPELEELLDAEEGVEGHEDYELTMSRPGVWVMPDGEEFPAEGTAKKEEAVAHIADEYGEGLALQVTSQGAEV